MPIPCCCWRCSIGKTRLIDNGRAPPLRRDDAEKSGNGPRQPGKPLPDLHRAGSPRFDPRRHRSGDRRRCRRLPADPYRRHRTQPRRDRGRFLLSRHPRRADLRLRIHRIRQGEPGRPVGPYRRPRLHRPHDLGAALLHAPAVAPHDRPQPEPGQGRDLQGLHPHGAAGAGHAPPPGLPRATTPSTTSGFTTASHALGAFCSGGTIANVTALWVARNRLFAPDGAFRGIAQEGLARALQAPRLSTGSPSSSPSAATTPSARPPTCSASAGTTWSRSMTDAHNRIDLQAAAAGVPAPAGTRTSGRWRWSASPAPPRPATSTRWRRWPTSPGSSAATSTSMPPGAGRPSSPTATATCSTGIERADSVTIDAHKQLYVPMGAGMVVFKDPTALSAIEHHANYILRHGSKDLGSHTLEGSRPGMAMLVHAGLSIIGRKGYELLIDMGIERARTFADHDPPASRLRTDQRTGAEHPHLPLLSRARSSRTLARATPEQRGRINALLDQVNQLLQKYQREAGKTFVSRTRLRVAALWRGAHRPARRPGQPADHRRDPARRSWTSSARSSSSRRSAALLEHVEALSKEISAS